MTDQSPEPFLTAREVAERLPRRRAGRPTKAATVRRWMETPSDGGGLYGVQLRSQAFGSSNLTKWSWVERFFAVVEGVRKRGRERIGRTKEQKARSDRAVAELERMGI